MCLSMHDFEFIQFGTHQLKSVGSYLLTYCGLCLLVPQIFYVNFRFFFLKMWGLFKSYGECLLYFPLLAQVLDLFRFRPQILTSHFCGVISISVLL